MRLFEEAAAEYGAARPSYPKEVYDLLDVSCGGLAGKSVADGGAGTGVVTRQLIERHAKVVAFDPGERMLRKATARTVGLEAAIADGAASPFRSGVFDLVCWGQSWHWVDQPGGTAEIARILKPGGWWAAWWNHPWADQQSWFDDYYSLLESTCPGMSRNQRNIDWCAETIAASDAFDVARRHIFSWQREVSVEDWLIDLRSHSYVIGLGEDRRGDLLRDVEAILRKQFVNGEMQVAYQTRLWMARRV